jgi:hypothetical protein
VLINPDFLASLPAGWAEAELVHRATALKVEPHGRPGVYMVDGGTEPHWVNTVDPDVPACDCGDHLWRERVCKHGMAVLLHQRDPHARLAAWRALAGNTRRIRTAAERVDLPVMGVLQNTWARDPERVQRLIDRYPEQRRDLIRSLLFMGSTTGRRLRDFFGGLCDHVTWEEASPQIGTASGARFPADLDHLRRAFSEVRPLVVLAFGRVAQQGVRDAGFTGAVIDAPHPAARHATMRDELYGASREILKVLKISQVPTTDEGIF